MSGLPETQVCRSGTAAIGLGAESAAGMPCHRWLAARRMITVLAAVVGVVAGAAVAGTVSAPPADASAAAPVATYRPAPGAVQSPDFQVSVNGTPAFVTAYKDVNYASFAFQNTVTVTVTRSAGGLDAAQLLPQGAATVTGSSSQSLTFTLRNPANLVLTPPNSPRLFLFADSLSANPATPSGNNVQNVSGLGVHPGSAAVQTTQIQQAIDAVAGQGGGILYFPPGRYLTGTLNVRSHVTLYLSDGALIQGTADPADYPVDPGRTESGTNGATMTYSRLIYFDGVQDAGIAGRGVIDGNGKALRQAGRNSNLIRVAGSSNVHISNVVLRDSAAWNTHVLHSTDVQVSNVRIINDVTNPNTDGVDVDSSSDITVDRVFTYVGDDALVVKATNNSGQLADPHGITFSDCVILTNKTAMKLGTESLANRFYGINFTDNSVVASDRAIGLVSQDGATYENIQYTGDTIYGTSHLFEESIDPRTGSTAAGQIDGVTFQQLRAVSYHPSDNNTANNKSGFVFIGRDTDHQVSNLLFKDVLVNGHQLTDYATAAKYALLSFGPYVQGVQFQTTGPAATPTSLALAPAGSIKAGAPATVNATFSDDATDGKPIQDLALTLDVPYGWAVQPAGPTTFATAGPGQQIQASWSVTPPADFFGAATLYAHATYLDPSGQRSTTIEGSGSTVAVQSGLVDNISPPYLADTRVAANGANFLVDRTYSITSLPAALAGGVLIPGANADKGATSPADYLTFDVSRDVTVYVAFDLRGEGTWWPSWLTDDGFTLTDMQIGTSDHPYAVLAKNMPAGQVSLGPNLDAPASNLNSYFTVVVPR